MKAIISAQVLIHRKVFSLKLLPKIKKIVTVSLIYLIIVILVVYSEISLSSFMVVEFKDVRIKAEPRDIVPREPAKEVEYSVDMSAKQIIESCKYVQRVLIIQFIVSILNQLRKS